MTEAQQKMREIVEEFKAGVYADSYQAAQMIANVIEDPLRSGQGFAWLMIMLDDNLPVFANIGLA